MKRYSVVESDWQDFWENPTLQEREQSIEDSLIHLSRRKLKLLQEVEELNFQIQLLRNQLS